MIGVFDSGIGGFTVLREIVKSYPNNNYIYYSDSLNNPYGDKTNEEIIQMVDKIVNYLINNNCHIIVIACNTSSLIAFDYLKDKYPDTTFIKTIPALYKINRNNKTLVMATLASTESKMFNSLLKEYKNNYTYVLPCISLADLIEEGNIDKIDTYLNEKLSNYKGVKDVILGCTHYPLIKNNIRKVLGNVNFIDCYEEIINELKSIIPNDNNETSITFIDTKNRNIEKKYYSINN